MKVGIIGGTGGMGKGFAVRWCKDHNVLIGSRDAERANASAQEYSELVKDFENNRNILVNIQDLIHTTDIGDYEYGIFNFSIKIVFKFFN